MNLQLHTPVRQLPRQVFAGFDQRLFEALAPPVPQLQVLRFDGCRPGDRVEVLLRLGPVRHRMTSLITEQQETAQEVWFTDEGQELPWPLKSWRHRHLIRQLGATGSCITEDICYATGSRLLDLLVYPFLYAFMAYRRPVYRKWFGTPEA